MAVSANTRKGGWLETATIVIEALAIAMVVRTFLYQPFNIPSGSMKETLLVGDYLFVSKLSYGYSRYSFYNFIPFEGRIFAAEPKRGDVAVFKLPRDNSTDYIKRVVGLPGDRIQMIRGVLHINGKAVEMRRVEDFVGPPSTCNVLRNGNITVARYIETLPNGVQHELLDCRPGAEGADDTSVFEVPPAHYFMMGDNRDNSADSRFDVGFVPRENLIGRADIMFFSIAETASFFAPWRWPFEIRWARFFNLID
ncbi:MAG: signal peptidase I [Hyphomicrobium sp.]|nr:signal peptidase I [Hyphomicrobium sp.]